MISGVACNQVDSSILPKVTRRDDADRARYIEKAIERGDDEYFKPNSDMRREYTEILERLAGPNPDDLPPAPQETAKP